MLKLLIRIFFIWSKTQSTPNVDSFLFLSLFCFIYKRGAIILSLNSFYFLFFSVSTIFLFFSLISFMVKAWPMWRLFKCSQNFHQVTLNFIFFLKLKKVNANFNGIPCPAFKTSFNCHTINTYTALPPKSKKRGFGQIWIVKFEVTINLDLCRPCGVDVRAKNLISEAKFIIYVMHVYGAYIYIYIWILLYIKSNLCVY